MTTSLTANLILQKTKLDHLRHVRRLNVCGAQVSHIHVLRDAINVEVLSLSVNQIEDLSPLSFLEELRELYLRKNRISDLMQVLHLSQLEQLTVLGMSENPISIDPSYRPFIIAAIPTLWKLDDVEITPTERRQAEAEFSEIRHWAPPDPIPFSQIGVSPQSDVSSPRRMRGNADERDNLASTYGGSGAHTARRRHAHHINDDDRDDPYARVPATARKPSTASSSPPNVPAHAHKPHTHTKHNPNSDQSDSSFARGGDGGNGWDDVPVGGGGARGKRPSASSAATAGGGVRVEGVQHHKVESDQGVGGSSFPPAGTSPSPSSSSSLRPPPINLAPAAQKHIDLSILLMGASDDHPIRHDKTRRESAVTAKVGVKASTPIVDDRAETLHRAAPAVEEGIVSAVKLLLDQLSPAAVEEVLRYATSKRR